MSTLCERTQQQLLEEGPHAQLDDPLVRAHLLGCGECFDLLAAVWRVHTREALAGEATSERQSSSARYVRLLRYIAKQIGRILVLPGRAGAYFLQPLWSLERNRPYVTIAAIALMSVVAGAGLITVLLLYPVDMQSLRSDFFSSPDRFASLILKPPAETAHKKKFELSGTLGGAIASTQAGAFGFAAGMESTSIQAASQPTTPPEPVVTDDTKASCKASPYDVPSSVALPTERPTEAPSNAADFLAGRSRIEGLVFKASRGYWANTYVPGDPALRLLHTRLRSHDRSDLGDARLERSAQRIVEPFDPPTHAALAVYTSASESGVTGETRLLMQVGLRATSRHSALRPAMQIGVVLDLRGEVSSNVGAAIRALLVSLRQAHTLGDRFTLVVAGKPGGLLIEPANFRHGPLTVALGALLGDGPLPAGEPLTPVEAMRTAVAAVRTTDNPNEVLGASLILFVTAQPLFGAVDELEALAHKSAVAGIQVSVVGVGPDVEQGELDRITLAGQGNRRLLESAAGAESLVDHELAAVGRVVARAVRLRIALAPGVRLIDVIGSHRLGEACATRVRRAEQSVDRRMARNHGIIADRGDDEAGIQIVIPTFYAGDSHAVLLDVVVPGPGPVADVSLRYKDLVHLTNGTVRARLALPRREIPPGPLQRNVLKNFLAWQLADTLSRAGEHLALAEQTEAVSLLADHERLLADLQRSIPGLTPDPDLKRDLEMLAEYRAVLERSTTSQRQLLSDSLLFASLVKVRPQPAW